MKMMGGIMMGYCFFLPVLLIGCGLPNYASIDPPTVVSTGLETTVAFRTPADDQNINGYIVYYKIYTGDSDYSVAGESDAEKFNDETSYSNNEIPMGETVPKQRGFFRVGKLGQSVFSDYTITHSSIGANTTVYIDFHEDEEKVLIYTDPQDLTNTTIAELARGVLDYRHPDSSFRSFYKDWDYDSDNGQHTDSDLRRNSNTSGLLQYQPVGSQVDFDAIKARSTLLDDLDRATIRVGIAVYAAGRDPETLKSLDSQPVHIGSVSIGTPLADTDR